MFVFICDAETDNVLGEVEMPDHEARHYLGSAGSWRASSALNQTQLDTCGIDGDAFVYAAEAN